jgi:hypothetical protein
MTASSHARAEAAAQVGLMLGVGSVAACASWSHVVDLAASHGQQGWLAVADAAVVETLAVSMGLEIRRRRRTGESGRFAVCVLIAAVTLQLSAQVAQAPRTFWGWTMAALPAIGFLLLAKVAIARGPLVPRAPGFGGVTSADGRAASDAGERRVGAGEVVRPARPRVSPAAPLDAVVDPQLLAAGRSVAADLADSQEALTRVALIRGLRQRGVAVGTARAGRLLTALKSERSTDAERADGSVRIETAEQTTSSAADRALKLVGEDGT